MKIRNIPTRNALAALILLGAGTGILFATHALRPAQAAGENAAKPALTVTVTHPESTSIASSFSANGNIVAWQEALIGAEVVRQEGKLGTIAPGAYADLIVVDGDPLKKLELFLDQGAHLPVIMKAGKFHKNTLK